MPSSMHLEHTYQHPWEVIVEQYWRKYEKAPSCYAPDILDVKYEDIGYDESTQTTTYTRYSKIEIKAPSWLKKMAGVNTMQFRTTVTLSRHRREMCSMTKNITFEGKIDMREVCVYKVSSENPDWTTFTTTANLSVVYIFGVSSTLESVILNNYKEATKLARLNEKAHISAIANSNIPALTSIEEEASTANEAKPALVEEKEHAHVATSMRKETFTSTAGGTTTISQSSSTTEFSAGIFEFSRETIVFSG